MKSEKIILLICSSILISMLAVITNLSADGCFFRVKGEQVGNKAESPNQRALIIHDQNKETLVVQVKYQGDVGKFSWVLPVPSIPEENSITTVSDSIFTHLHDRTQPKLFIYSARNYGKGDQDAGSDSDAEIYQETGVTVWEKLQVGPYEIAVISSPISQALINWLIENGYDFPEQANQIIEFYTQKNWYFVAMRVSVANQLEKSNSTYQAGLPAIKMTFKSEKPVFPLRISELTSAKENEIELYVATKHRMTCESYHAAQMNRDEVQLVMEKSYYSKLSKPSGIACACERIFAPESDAGMEYEELFQQKIASFAEPTFIVEHASIVYDVLYDGNHDTDSYHYCNDFFADYLPTAERFWITRFRTILTPNSMKDDVNFKPDPNGDNYFALKFWIEEKQPNPWSYSIYITPAFVLAPIPFSKRIRKKYGKQLLLLALLLMMAIL